ISAFYHQKLECVSAKRITPPEKIVTTIRENPPLQDLAQRPLLLVMMLDIFTDYREAAEREWDKAKLYHHYTEKWLKHEAAKPDSVLKWHEKAVLMQEIAWSLYAANGTAISPQKPY